MNNTERKPIHAACKRAEPTRRLICEKGGRSIECVQDKCGIHVERFIVAGGRSLILYATPDWCDVYRPVHDGNSLADFHAALAAFIDAGKGGAA